MRHHGHSVLVERGAGGSLVATASLAALEGQPRGQHYGATKGGLSGRVRAALPFGATIVYEVEAADGTMLKALDMRAGRQPLAVGSPVTIGLADSAHCRVYID